MSDPSCYIIIIHKTQEATGQESLTTPSWLICSFPTLCLIFLSAYLACPSEFQFLLHDADCCQEAATWARITFSIHPQTQVWPCISFLLVECEQEERVSILSQSFQEESVTSTPCSLSACWSSWGQQNHKMKGTSVFESLTGKGPPAEQPWT